MGIRILDFIPVLWSFQALNKLHVISFNPLKYQRMIPEASFKADAEIINMQVEDQHMYNSISFHV